jgi:hypothetical protein
MTATATHHVAVQQRTGNKNGLAMIVLGSFITSPPPHRRYPPGCRTAVDVSCCAISSLTRCPAVIEVE